MAFHILVWEDRPFCECGDWCRIAMYLGWRLYFCLAQYVDLVVMVIFVNLNQNSNYVVTHIWLWNGVVASMWVRRISWQWRSTQLSRTLEHNWQWSQVQHASGEAQETDASVCAHGSTIARAGNRSKTVGGWTNDASCDPWGYGSKG
jgi:hypothetical protein